MTIDSAIFHHGTQGGWIKCAENPVLGGDLGVCFDICCLKEEGLVRMYFSWRTRQCIAVAVSRDGLHFDAPEICIQPRETAQGWEDGLNRPAVVKRGNVYHMWYTGQFKRGAADGTSHIFHAVSQDGVHFERTGDLPVLAPEAVWEKQAVMCPAVLWDEEKGLYRMWYSGGEQYEPNAIGYAESPDGLHWRKHPGNPVFGPDPASAWEQHKTTACQVLRYGDEYRMFYIGFHNEDYAQIGMARSKDGIEGWERSALNPIIAPDENAWDGEACYKPFVLPMGDGWMLWYNGRRGRVEQIGAAWHPGKNLEF